MPRRGKRTKVRRPREDAAQLRLIVDNLPAMSIAYDENLCCLFANRRFAEFFGLTTASIVGRHLREIVGEGPYQEIKPHFDQVLAGRRTTYQRTRILDGGERRHLEVELIPHLGKDGRTRGLFAVTTDVTERKREEQLSSLGNSVAELIASADSSTEAVQAVIRAICETERWDCGRYFQASPDGSVRRFAGGWGIGDAAIQEFLRRSKDLEYLPGSGLIDQVWNSGSALWVADVEHEPRALRKAYPEELLSGGVFQFPVKSRDAVIGVLIFNSRERRAPDEPLLKVILDIGSRIGQFLHRKRAEERLRQSEASLAEAQRMAQQLIEALPNPIYFKDTEGRYLGVNKAWEAFFGTPREKFLGRTVHDLYPDSPETADRLRADDQALWDHPGTSRMHEQSIKTPDGKRHEAIYYKATLTRADGGVAGLIGTIIDITERKQAERALRDSMVELRLLTDNVPAMIISVDRKMHCVFANERYADFFGFGMTDLVGKSLPQIVGDAAYVELKVHFEKALAGQPVTYQRNVQRKSGEQRCIEVKLVPRAAQQGQIPGFYSMSIDITEQKQAEERIQKVAHHDSLTGLPNRLLFNDRLGQAILLAKRDARQFALLYLDLDKFKPVNDTFGHDAGDQVLVGVAGRIREQVRDSDTVARIGGDEFAVILRDISGPQDAATVAQKIIASLVTPFRLDNRPQAVEIGVSIGIAVYPSEAQDHDSLIRKADTAMYSAKTRGNCFLF